MENGLSPEEACRLIGEDLGIDRSRVRPCLEGNGSRISCLVHESWIQRYTTGVPSHDWVEPVSPWTPYEHQLLLQPSHPGPAASWLRISIQVIKKPIKKSLPVTESFSDIFGNGLPDVSGSGDLLFADLLQNVGLTLYKHSWDRALASHSLAIPSYVSALYTKPSDKNAIKEILSQSYNLPVVKLFPSAAEEDAIQPNEKDTDSFDEAKEQVECCSWLHIMKQNVVPFVCALEGKTAYFLIEPYFQHSLHDIVTFSPSVLSSSHVRPLFVIYELMHALRWYHSQGISHGDLTLQRVKVRKGLWIHLQSPDLMDSLVFDPVRDHQQGKRVDSNSSPLEADEMEHAPCKARPQLNRDKDTAWKWTRNDLPCLVQQWVNGELNNYEYLMALNYLAGRRFGDPNYHPVFPWVTDFSLPDGQYRDLRKSKFRLNKGDRQLDVTYRAAWLDNQDGISTAVPHHVSDVLSDITYHVYLARRTPKSVLCDHVRTHWVPNEYPSSMERLYHWTPDECIPQFFSDCSIFESIHPDLPDLEVPSWTATPEDFIKWHRSVLESETVSLNLHHWIDLTFGHKLSGKDAVKAKNVYLHLIDKHQSLSNHGVLQLFAQAHPQRSRQCSSSLFGDGDSHLATDKKHSSPASGLEGTSLSNPLEESITSLNSNGDGDLLIKDRVISNKTSESDQVWSNKSGAPPKEGGNEEEGMRGAQFELITLPSNYNPLNLLQKFEALEKFRSQFGPRPEPNSGSLEHQAESEAQFRKLVQRDMVNLGCLIVEMLIPEKVRLATSGLTRKDRQTAIVNFCAANQKLLPRYAKTGVWALLRELSSSTESGTGIQKDNKLDAWIPPLTPDTLLQPHMGLFPFPLYFGALHHFLAAFYHSSQGTNSQEDWQLLCLREKDGGEYCVEQVDTAASFLPDLLAKVDDEGVKLLLHHLEPLFACSNTRLVACMQLFDMLAQALGPKSTLKTFLKCLMSLFDSHSLENYQNITRQHFLSQIIVRFGLDGFLKHFIGFVVEAVAFQSMMDAESQSGRKISCLQIIEGVVPGFSPNHSLSRKQPVSLDMDDDLTTDLQRNFLISPSEDQEDELNYSIAVDDVESEFASEDLLRGDSTAADLQCIDKVEGGEKKSEVSGQVRLVPKHNDEEGSGKLLLPQNSASYDDDKARTNGPVISRNDDDAVSTSGPVRLVSRPEGTNCAEVSDDSLLNLSDIVVDSGGTVDTARCLDDVVTSAAVGDGIDVGDNDSYEDIEPSATCTNAVDFEVSGTGAMVDVRVSDKDKDFGELGVQRSKRVAQELGKKEAGQEQRRTKCKPKKMACPLKNQKAEHVVTKELESHASSINVECHVVRDGTEIEDNKDGALNLEGHVEEDGMKIKESNEKFGEEEIRGDFEDEECSKSSSSHDEVFPWEDEEEFDEKLNDDDDDDDNNDDDDDNDDDDNDNNDDDDDGINDDDDNGNDDYDDGDNDDDDNGNEYEEDVSGGVSRTPVAYEVQTFYSNSKSEASRKEEGVERDHHELTPGAISGIAAESIVWLAPRLGPVLTSNYIANQLLTMLPHCYIGHVGTADSSNVMVVNDHNAKWLLFCLGNFCMLYGEAFMLHQYLPYIEKTIKSVQNKITSRSEAALAGVLSLLKYCIPYLSRDTLRDYCESELMKEVFQPVIRVLSSYATAFPGGVAARQAICRSYIDVLTVVCLKLERELARENMTAPLQQFFSCFELDRMRKITDQESRPALISGDPTPTDGPSPGIKPGPEEDAVDASNVLEKYSTGASDENSNRGDFEALYNSPVYGELCHTFSAAIAHHAFVPLCGILGSKYMEGALYNHDLIWNLCCSYDAQLSHPTCENAKECEDEDERTSDVEHATEVDSPPPPPPPPPPTVPRDNKLEESETTHGKKGIKRGIEKFKAKRKPPMWFIGRGLSKQRDGSPKLTPSSSSSDQYLRGSWLEHWQNQLNMKVKAGNNLAFHQVKLQTFTGHSGTVRSLYVQDSEHCFLSASKDKTVKLWSLSNHGDGTAQSASSWTYYNHSRPVFHVGMVESVRQAVSCDGSLHLWDPVSGRCLGMFDPPRNNPVVAMTTLPPPSQCVVAAMAEGTARFLDVRQHSFVQEWKVTTSTLAGTVRDICCSPDGRWIALGFSSGLASVLDIRGGLLRSQRRAHTSDIFQVKAFSNNSFVTSSVDQGLSLWKDDGLRLKTLKGHSDPLPSILVWHDQVISASVSGKVGVHNLQDDQSEASYFSYKLSGDVFRGGITCLGYLPLNRLLLIGSDTGNISLCS